MLYILTSHFDRVAEGVPSFDLFGLKKKWNEDQIFEQQPSTDLSKVKCVHTEVLGFILIVLLAFSQAKNVKNDVFSAKINSVAHCKLSLAAPFTTNLSKPWPLSLGHVQR